MVVKRGRRTAASSEVTSLDVYVHDVNSIVLTTTKVGSCIAIVALTRGPWIGCVAVLAAGPRSACGESVTIRSFFKLPPKLAMVTKSSAANKRKVSSCRDGSFQDPWMHQLTARSKCGSPWHTKCVTYAWQTRIRNGTFEGNEELISH